MLSVLAIIIPLIVLVIMIWKKVNIAVSAIVCTGLMALMSGLNIYDCLTNDYMEAFVGYIKNYWPLIFLGASFGKAMQRCRRPGKSFNFQAGYKIHHCSFMCYHTDLKLRRCILLRYRIRYVSDRIKYV